MTFRNQHIEQRWAGLAVLLTAAFMALLDVSIVFVATPSIASDLHASPAQVEWVVAGYSLAFALALISGGRLGDLYGRRRMFRIGLTMFALGSALCGAAPTAALLIAARLFQGVGAAAMMPQVLSIIQVDFEPHERGRALALMGAVQGIAVAGGQIVGGALIELDPFGLGWRSVFLINVPIAVAALIASGPLVRESRSPDARRLDLGGVALALLAVGALVFPLVEGRSAGWPAWAFVSMAASLPLGALFVAWERRVDRRGGAPLVVLELFQLRPFRIGSGIALLTFAGAPGIFLAIAIYLQAGLGLPPLEAGLTFLPCALAFFVASLVVARLSIPARERLLAPAAAAVSVGALALGAITAEAGHVTWLALAGPLTLMGGGQGIVIPGLNGVVLSETHAAHAGSASGVLATFQQIGAALGVAIVGTLLFSVLGDGTGAAAYGDALGAATVYIATVLAVVALLCTRLVATSGTVGRSSVPFLSHPTRRPSGNG